MYKINPPINNVGAKCKIVCAVDISSLYETGILSAGGIPSSSCVCRRRDSNASTDPIVKTYGAGPCDGDGSAGEPLGEGVMPPLLGIGAWR
jgi:hypothetical protein